MSVHSVDHIDEEASDLAYKGYQIDEAGEVTEFYDHRGADAASSSVPVTSVHRQPLITTNGSGQNSVPIHFPRQRVVKYRDAGCCNGCVRLLTTIGTMPFATGFAFFCSWLGTALFIAGGWKALDETLILFAKYGPSDGNPATDPAPEYVISTGQSPELRSPENLGNRVPQVFADIKKSFYVIIPFVFCYTIFLAIDNYYVAKSLRKNARNCKTSSSGICITAGLIACTYLLILGWIFFLCFTTLGVYYYRIVMLRCYDLNDRGFTEGVLHSICLDLVQLGLIMFKNTIDDGYGLICGPAGDPALMRTFGRLAEYCDGYYPIYQFMLLAFTGCMLNIIAMINFLMILTNNYGRLTNRLTAKKPGVAASTIVSTVPTASTYIPSTAASGITHKSVTSIPPYIKDARSYASDGSYAAPCSTVGMELTARSRHGSRDDLDRLPRQSSRDDLDRRLPRRSSRDDLDYRARRSSRDDLDYRARRSSRDDLDRRAKRSSKDIDMIDMDYVLSDEGSSLPHYR